MYLPQFYRTPENDQWWGEGFTDWKAVKTAKCLYEGHEQPRIPQNNKYYNLLEHDVMAWQTELMKKYEIDGLCMYHYWFKDGKKVLEKPAENLLRWKDILMPFCFCWANQTWARSWSRLQDKNTWADTYEKEKEPCGNGILLEQRYGREEQWKEHFEYLLPFFFDERYIRVDGRPLFLIHNSSDIFCLIEMLDYWRELCKAHGLPELYVVGAKGNRPNLDCLEGILNRQPSGGIGRLPVSCKYTKNGITVWEYDDIWSEILNERMSEQTLLQGVVGYDDTPRRGTEGQIVEHATPEKFSFYLTELLAKSAAFEKDIVFLNAWNEWGEGMYLEPDESCGDGYLKAVPVAKRNYKHLIGKYRYIEKINREMDARNGVKTGNKVNKEQYYLHMLDHWMALRENGFLISAWLKRADCKKIAVYGYGILGKHLCSELSKSEILVEYVIDQKKDSIHTEYKVYLPYDEIPEIETVIVTAIFDYEKIYKNLRSKGICKVISLESILYEN